MDKIPQIAQVDRRLEASSGIVSLKLSTHHSLNRSLVHCFQFGKRAGNMVRGFHHNDVAYNEILDWDVRGIYTGYGNGPRILHRNNIAAGNFTVRKIFKIEHISANEHVLIDKGSELYVAFDSSGNLKPLVIGGTTSSSVTLGLVEDVIYDLIIQRSGTSVTVYLNGVLKSTQTNSGVTVDGVDLGVGISISDPLVANLRGWVYSFEAWSVAHNALNLTFTPFAERLSNILPYERPLAADSVAIGEAIAITADYSISIADSIVLTENILPGLDVGIIVRDTLYVKETIQPGANISIIAMDIVKFESKGGRTYNISASDSMSMTEGPLERKLASDSITFGETVTPKVGKVVADVILFAEGTLVIRSVAITVVDSITFIGDISGYALIDNQYSPSIGGMD